MSYLDRVEVDEDIIKLFEEEEAGGHTLAARDCVCNTADYLELWYTQQWDYLELWQSSKYSIGFIQSCDNQVNTAVVLSRIVTIKQTL